MRTTLDIDEDVLQAAKEIAKRKRATAGQVLSELARAALRHAPGTSGRSLKRRAAAFLGFQPFEGRGGIVTDEMVNELRETEPD
jgi:hypothetical protein